MKRKYGFVEVHSSGFPLKQEEIGEERKEAVDAANKAYNRAANTGCAAGIRFGVLKDGHINGKLVMTKSRMKYPRGPFK